MQKIKLEWILRAKTQHYKKNLDRAIKSIEEAQKYSGVISWSTGKDSTVVAHLVKKINPSTPIIIQCDDCDWPEKKEYMKEVAQQQNWEYHVVEPSFSVWDAVKDSDIGVEAYCSSSHDLTKYAFIKPLVEKQKELGANLVYMGLRAEEGFARKMNYLKRGELYKCQYDSFWHCCPIGAWTTLDVFAYLAENNVLINPCYFHNRLKQPEEIRLSWAIPTPRGYGEGETEHMRLYYRKQYERLRKIGKTV